jgi:hypothetical protein
MEGRAYSTLVNSRSGTQSRGHQAKRVASAWHQKSLPSLGSTSRASRKAASRARHIVRASSRCVSSAASASRAPSPQSPMISAGLASLARPLARRHACSRANRKPDQVFVNQDATLGMRASTQPGMVRNGAPGRWMSSLRPRQFEAVVLQEPCHDGPDVEIAGCCAECADAQHGHDPDPRPITLSPRGRRARNITDDCSVDFALCLT